MNGLNVNEGRKRTPKSGENVEMPCQDRIGTHKYQIFFLRQTKTKIFRVQPSGFHHVIVSFRKKTYSDFNMVFVQI